MPIIENFRNRPEIDGLRAIAVLAVVFYHVGLGCPGGYVGVDVFFVISGFLISSLIWKDLESSKFTILNFWERRCRRIVPAIAVVTIVTLIAGWFILLPTDLESLGQASSVQSFFAANFYYWQHTGYFQGSAESKPLLHTWSLAVEEQFYLLMPLLMWGIFQSVVLRRRKTVLCVLLVVFTLSLGWSIYSLKPYPTATFYLLPSRAWELLLGAIVAFLPAFPALMGRRGLREAMALLGIGLILFSVFRYTPNTAFPGLAAVPPCLGAALLIWSNGLAPTMIGSILSTRPIVFIGLISYSLYLWHWPVLAYSKYLAIGPISLAYEIAIIVFSLLVSIVSWKYIETPFRQRNWGKTRNSMFSFAAAGLLVMFGAGLFFVSHQGFPNRFAEQSKNYISAMNDRSFINELTIKEVLAGKLVHLGANQSGERPVLFVLGDSHAMSALPAVDSFLKEKGFTGYAATHSSTAPVFGWFARVGSSLREESIGYHEEIFKFIQKNQIPNVVLIARWKGYMRRDPHGSSAGYYSALLTTVKRFVDIGCQPWIMLDVPEQPFNVPQTLANVKFSRTYLTSICTKVMKEGELQEFNPQILAEIKSAGGRIIDPKPSFIDSTKQHYMIQMNGVALYRDNQHLTTKGANLVLLPFLRKYLDIGDKPMLSQGRQDALISKK